MNDLLFLRYGWGHKPDDGSGLTDCFQLTCEVMRRMGLRDYSPLFQWVYEQYDDDTFPRRKIVRWLLENGRRLDAPKEGAVALIDGTKGAALGTATDYGLIFLGPGGNVVHSPIVPPSIHYFWMN